MGCFRFAIFLVAMLAIFYGLILEGFLGFTGLSSIGYALFWIAVVLAGISFWRKGRKEKAMQVTKANAELPAVLNQIAALLAQAESGISEGGNTPTVVARRAIRSSNELIGEAMTKMREGLSSSKSEACRRILSKSVIDETEVGKFLDGKGDHFNIEGIDRFTAPARKAISQVQIAVLNTN